ncbi:MAG: LPS assembly protein LptD, partial [Xanthomonadales bacterium]|nr:LPS assembly protein LptD [Xanthomonadales bacterium]
MTRILFHTSAFPSRPLPASLLAAWAALMFVAAVPAHAQSADPQPAAVCPEPALSPLQLSTPDRDDAPLVMYAREMDAGKTQVSEARGQVEIIRADQKLTTEHLLFLPDTKTVIMPEPLEYEDAQVWIKAQKAEYSFDDETGHFSALNYGLSESSANGSAESMELMPDQRSVLKSLNFTTCPGPEPDWQIKADQMEFHHDKGYGTARHARLEFKGVPILYAPWFTFPIDDRRRSGLLYPSVSNTNDNGIEVGIPYYWNIAPNMDATILPRYFTDRGFMLSGDYRWLTRNTRGVLDFDYMPDDDKTAEKRWHYLLNSGVNLPGSWSGQLTLDRVSDDNYFQDFGASLVTTSRQFLHNVGIVQGYGHYWRFEAMADDFQVIDNSVTPENEPYKRLPRLSYRLNRPFGRTGFGTIFDSDLTYFDRDTGVTGARLDTAGHLYWERWASWGFVRPSLGYRYTTYDLEDVVPGADTSPDRGTTIASLDGGLFFDRVLSNGNTQTLEPRIFYLYVPFENQDDLPDFDSVDFTFGFSQLFNTNRFAGGDRQGDADQLSLALTTRTYSGRDGNQLWRLSVGQIVYFEDQQVQLDGNPAETGSRSPLIAEFSLNTFRRVVSTAGLQWDWDQDRL